MLKLFNLKRPSRNPDGSMSKRVMNKDLNERQLGFKIVNTR